MPGNPSYEVYDYNLWSFCNPLIPLVCMRHNHIPYDGALGVPITFSVALS
jgi:hypothetical protein